MRRLLDALYDGAAALVAAFVVGALIAATLLAARSAFYSARLVWQSRQFNDISTGNDATPLWIPQLGMAVGTLILLIAFIDELVLEWRGQRSHAVPDEAVRNE